MKLEGEELKKQLKSGKITNEEYINKMGKLYKRLKVI